MCLLATVCLQGHLNAGDTAFPYKVEESSGTSIEFHESGFSAGGEDRFFIRLVPGEGPAWNLGAVRVLGIEFRNTGTTELIIDLMLANPGATTWSNSALGRTIVRPGEEIPLAVGLPRQGDRKMAHPVYHRMSGKPWGHYRHWHYIDPENVTGLEIRGSAEGAYAFELGSLFPLQKMRPEMKGKLPYIDTYGQYIHGDWTGKLVSEKELQGDPEAERRFVKELGPPPEWGKYAGWEAGPQFEATGRFRVAMHGGRWWFIDPEGYLFWSFGATCVGYDYAGQTPTERDPAVFAGLPGRDDPGLGQFFVGIDVEDNYQLREDAPHFDFNRANAYRKYGEDWRAKAMEQELERLHYTGLNTIAAWSDVDITRQSDVPYTAMVHFVYASAAPKLPDPFDPRTREGLRESLENYPVAFKGDPRCLGAFVNNELHWKNSARELVVAILGYTSESTAAKEVFKDWLSSRYASIADLNTAWDLQLSAWDELLNGLEEWQLQGADTADCSALARLFAEAYFRLVDEELEAFDPDVLYLGSRFNSGSPEVLEAAARYVDVISANIYDFRPFPGRYSGYGKPVLISEFHFGNLDGNNLGSGLRSAQDAEQQGRLLKQFLEEAVEQPEVIGAHWFQWRDQNVGGRYDGENYDIGFFDVVDRPKKKLIRSAAAFARDMYSKPSSSGR